jgi:hypothetical protein
VYSIQHYVIKFANNLWQVGGFLRFFHQENWLPLYNWSIVESGIKHHKPNLYSYKVVQSKTVLRMQYEGPIARYAIYNNYYN